MNELQDELNSSQQKQSELLSFTSKLTEKITQLQSDNTVINEKFKLAQDELKSLSDESNQKNQKFRVEVRLLLFFCCC